MTKKKPRVPQTNVAGAESAAPEAEQVPPHLTVVEAFSSFLNLTPWPPLPDRRGGKCKKNKVPLLSGRGI